MIRNSYVDMFNDWEYSVTGGCEVLLCVPELILWDSLRTKFLHSTQHSYSHVRAARLGDPGVLFPHPQAVQLRRTVPVAGDGCPGH